MNEVDSEMRTPNKSAEPGDHLKMTTSKANMISNTTIWSFFLYEGWLIVHFIKSFLHDKNIKVSSYFIICIYHNECCAQLYIQPQNTSSYHSNDGTWETENRAQLLEVQVQLHLFFFTFHIGWNHILHICLPFILQSSVSGQDDSIFLLWLAYQ